MSTTRTNPPADNTPAAPPLLPDSARPAVSRARYGLLASLFVITAINYLDRTNLSVALPHIKDDFHLSATEQGVLLSSFGWAYLLLQIPTGRLIDRVGAKLAFGYALIGWSLATAAMALTRGFGSLIGVRVALGAFEAPAFPSNNRLVVNWFPGRERGRATATYTAGEYIGLAIAAPVLSLLTVHFGWHSVFLVTGAIGLLFSVVWFRRVFDRPEQSPRVSAEELAYIRQADEQETADAAEKAAASEPADIWADLRVLLTNRRLWGMYIGQFASASVLFFFLTWFPSYLVEEKDMGVIKAGFWASAPYLAALIGTLVGGAWSDRMLNSGKSRTFARKAPVMIGFVLASIIVCANFTNSVPLVITFMSIAFFAQGLMQNSWALFSDAVPRRLTGTGGGVFNFMANAGGVLTPLVIGIIVDRTGSFAWALGYIGIVVAVGLLAYALLIDKVERVEA
ncbi:MFS transporter [Streptomyces sp. NBS 14/10]|uniref:MFS transporter n=1 Tax=Streptomyces sp. NBS 14/10 TaxID=1945643 RepID=UPI000B7C73F4|nr:MFS transporter [Streptomyces sp. NBS 14/10]KAK1179068.1 MFS transporter [Streptomyces sp. NBS 14/10]NUS84477.1 MFS transporter [Streptomyces sp.]